MVSGLRTTRTCRARRPSLSDVSSRSGTLAIARDACRTGSAGVEGAAVGAPPLSAVEDIWRFLLRLAGKSGNTMRWSDGQLVCAQCGEVLDVPDDAMPQVVIIGASGKSNFRALTVRGEEIHRCEIRRDGAEPRRAP